MIAPPIDMDRQITGEPGLTTGCGAGDNCPATPVSVVLRA